MLRVQALTTNHSLADLRYSELHVALAAADPHVSKKHVLERGVTIILTAGSDRVWPASVSRR